MPEKKVVWMVSMCDNNDEVLFSNEQEAEKFYEMRYRPDNNWAGVDEVQIYDTSEEAITAGEL